MTRAVLGRAEILKHSRELRSARRKRRIYALIALPLVLFIALVALAHWDRLLINEISIEGAQTIESSVVRDKALAVLTGRYARLFPRRNIFLWPRQAIERELTQAYPVLGQIDVQRTGQSLAITVEERLAEYLWCGAGETEAPCLFLDRDGFAFDQAPEFLGQPFFEIINRSVSPTLGARPLAFEDFQHLAFLRRELAQVLGDSIITKTPTRVYLEVVGEFIFQVGDTLVMTTRLAKPEQVALNLQTAINAPAFVQEYQKRLASGEHLEYLDLRSEGKMFYKFGT